MQYRNYYSFMDFNLANQQLLQWYGKGYHFLNNTMLLDMIQTQVQNKIIKSHLRGALIRLGDTMLGL